MKQFKPTAALARLSPVPLTLVATACAAVDASPLPQLPAPPAPTGPSAGDTDRAAQPDRDAAAIAALRARGRAGLDELFAQYDKLAPGPAHRALGATIDKVAGQRYATMSRLYWHTDLPQALAEARRTGKPVLSLRLLGRLDEDLSCANSRFFRTVLYPDPAIAKLLREAFVLHWSSERPVPRVTIDFGDGRRIERTVTGNSVHYVLDAEGRPVDAIPGLYAPSAFREELERSRALHRELAAAGDRGAQLFHDHHERRLVERNQQLGAIGAVGTVRGLGRLTTPEDFDNAFMSAQRAAMSKAYVEVRETAAMMELDANPTQIADDVATWAPIAQTLYRGLGTPVVRPRVVKEAPVVRSFLGQPIVLARPDAAPRPPSIPTILSKPARALVAAIARDVPRGVTPPDTAAVTAMIQRFELTLVADTAVSELRTRQVIRQELMRRGRQVTFDALNRYIYDVAFATPATDPWLGLLPRDTYTGLPGDGAIVSRR